jgi:chorismate mutase
MKDNLHQVREEIRKADEELVRELAAALGESGEGWAAREMVRRRIAMGGRVAACKFARDPDRYGALARARDVRGLERAITDARMEEAVLERVSKQALDLGCAADAADRIAAFFRDRIIPETKTVQIHRLCELG